jgi:squalene-hopene/tetraprenyl-beta-curcumene cyclase
MNAHRFLARLLAGALITASHACFADEAAKQTAPPAPTPPAAKPTAAANPAEAAKNAKPAKPAKAPEPVKPPDEAKLRATLTKSLAFLAKENEAWMEEKGCNSCHHLPELIWTHREAKRRGFAVDQKKFDEWLAWANNEAPKKAGGSQEAAFMLLAMPEKPDPAVVKTVLAEQRPDGGFPGQGQFAGAQQRGKADADATTLRVFLLALASAADSKAEADAALAKAAPLLQKKDAPTSLESLVFRILFAEHFGKAQEADALRAQILKLQRGDGGWSYIIGTNQSDPWATGEALYVLHASADPKTADAVARAQHWLLSQQGEDGSWPLGFSYISKGDRSSPEKAKSRKDATRIYTAFATDWATLGLLQAIPVKDAVATVQK